MSLHLNEDEELDPGMTEATIPKEWWLLWCFWSVSIVLRCLNARH